MRNRPFWWFLLVPGFLFCLLAVVGLWQSEGRAEISSLSSAEVRSASSTPTPFLPRSDASPFFTFSLQFVTSVPTVSPTPSPLASPPSIPSSPEPSPTPFAPVTPTAGLIWLSIVPDTPTPAFVPSLAMTGTGGERWIEVDLSEQRLYAYEGETLVNSFLVSTGTWKYPTVTGTFRIYVKLRYADMSGPDYYLPDVPYVMYFYKGYGLHGTYWHNNFGTPMSHGCVNLSIPDAAWLYNWASVGTVVRVHE
ncbi:MAG: L,D-transpeptidase [Anaerolineales bacterium]